MGFWHWLNQARPWILICLLFVSTGRAIVQRIRLRVRLTAAPLGARTPDGQMIAVTAENCGRKPVAVRSVEIRAAGGPVLARLSPDAGAALPPGETRVYRLGPVQPPATVQAQLDGGDFEETSRPCKVS